MRSSGTDLISVVCPSFFAYKSFTEQYGIFYIDHNNISFRTLALIVIQSSFPNFITQMNVLQV